MYMPATGLMFEERGNGVLKRRFYKHLKFPAFLPFFIGLPSPKDALWGASFGLEADQVISSGTPADNGV